MKSGKICCDNIFRKTSSWTGIILLIALEVFFLFAFNGLFPFSVEKINQISGGKGIPDALFFYSFKQLSIIFQSYGVDGKDIYLRLQLIDMFYPIIYSLLLGSLLYIQLKKTKLVKLVYLPFIAAIFDYSENILLRINLLDYPEMNKVWVDFAAISTFLKWSFVYLSIFFIIIGLVKWIVSLSLKKTPE